MHNVYIMSCGRARTHDHQISSQRVTLYIAPHMIYIEVAIFSGTDFFTE